jgi:hypothetical protein
MYCHVLFFNVDQRFRDACCLHHQSALMMGAARTSETSVGIQLRTRQYIPEDSELIEGKAFGTGEGRAMRSEARREVEQGLSAFNLNLGFWH